MGVKSVFKKNKVCNTINQLKNADYLKKLSKDRELDK